MGERPEEGGGEDPHAPGPDDPEPLATRTIIVTTDAAAISNQPSTDHAMVENERAAITGAMTSGAPGSQV